MSKYYLFLDESGHHGLKKLDQENPIFVLCGVVISEEEYKGVLEPKINQLKQDYFGNTDIILHSRDIRKWQYAFSGLHDPYKRQQFYEAVNVIIRTTEFHVIASAIKKDELIKQYGPQSQNPYNISLTFILERTTFLTDRLECDRVQVIAEARGKKEDASLHTKYQLIRSEGTRYIEANRLQNKFSEIDFTKKSQNVIGVQLADLVAYPISQYVLHPSSEHLSFNEIEPKFYKSSKGSDYLGYGLKIFP